MNTPLPKINQVTFAANDFALKVQTIGLGSIGTAVLSNIRNHYGRHPLAKIDDGKFETEPSNELIFLVANLDIERQRDLGIRAGRHSNRAAEVFFVFANIDSVTKESDEGPLQVVQQTEPIYSPVTIDADSLPDANAAGEIIFERIQSIVSAIATPGAINVDYADFCHAMTGPCSGPIKDARATIKPAWGEAQGPDRALRATANALARPAFRKYLSQADGIMFSISGDMKNLMGREIKQISKEIRKHISDHCVCWCSICDDQDLESDNVKVEIFASQWGA